MPSQRLQDFLNQSGVRFQVLTHPNAYTVAAIGAVTHIPRKEFAKIVMVRVDGHLCMAVIPGSRHLDVGALKSALGAKSAMLVSEHDFESTFPDCELGAMPPFGVLYNLPVYVDEHLREDKNIFFNAGSHRELVKITYRDFERLQKPQVLRIATQSPAERAEEGRLGIGDEPLF